MNTHDHDFNKDGKCWCGAKTEALFQKEQLDRLASIEKKIESTKSEAADKGHTLILILLVIIFLRGC